ncbi:MAG: YgiT-type zinc finger protein [bacterium]
MKFIKKCPVCGGQVIEREVKEVLSGGINAAFLKVKAGVCLPCGERLYTPETVRLFEAIEEKLERQDTDDFQPLGKSFQIDQKVR